MITRRSFFGAVAALVMSPVAAKAVPVAAAVYPASVTRAPFEGEVFISTTTPGGRFGYVARSFCRRDDGDTILELR